MTGSTARLISFLVLVAIVLFFGTLSYEVLSAFLLPMFLAVLLVLVFKPLHVWISARCGGRERIAAGLTTLAVALIVLLPVSWLLYRAGRETVTLVKSVEPSEVTERVLTVVDKLNARLPEAARLPVEEADIKEWADQAVKAGWAQLQEAAGPLYRGAAQLVSAVIAALVLITVMLLSLYYFLADGPALRETFASLIPIQDEHKDELIAKFSDITRAVITAMVASALAQGALAGLGYFIAGINNVFLLTVLTMIFALVPFVGATVVWVPCVLWLYFHDDRPTAAIMLAIYGGVVISAADNLIKPLVLHGQSNLHPLLALLSIMGGASALGPIGILVGPMVLALLQTALVLLRQEMNALDDRPSGKPLTRTGLKPN
ncbi:MAG: AI-2E family transporter [Planctomycetaceae bacterium]|nr:AI-2E family transporter [Planctomycetaceae bacterium]